MKLTPAEKAHVKRERHRIALDAVDWSTRAVCTDHDLVEMSPWRADQIRSDKQRWVYDYMCFCLRNINHLDNEDWFRRRAAARLLNTLTP